MAGFLEEYGTADVRREKIVKWLVIAAILLVIGTITGYFVFRTWPAKRETGKFLEALQHHDYHAAYRIWGCRQPCPEYPLDKFMEDWGPASEFANASAAKIAKTRFCNTGVIVTLDSPKGHEVALWFERRDSTLGFSPWPVCAERIPAPEVPQPATR